VEKENGNRVVSANGPKDSVLIEQRISDGNGLLTGNGAGRANLFSGDAGDDLMVYSTLTSPGKFYRPSYYVFFANPYNFMRTLTLMVAKIWHEIGQRRRQVAGHPRRAFLNTAAGCIPWCGRRPQFSCAIRSSIR
jgi:putative membrane protein